MLLRWSGPIRQETAGEEGRDEKSGGDLTALFKVDHQISILPITSRVMTVAEAASRTLPVRPSTRGELTNDLEAGMESALLKLARVTAAHLRLVGQVVLDRPRSFRRRRR